MKSDAGLVVPQFHTIAVFFGVALEEQVVELLAATFGRRAQANIRVRAGPGKRPFGRKRFATESEPAKRDLHLQRNFPAVVQSRWSKIFPIEIAAHQPQ